MRKVLSAFCLFLMTALVTVQTAQAANPNAASIFNSIGGTTTIDRGGAIHSQARSIYSLGGGMTTFEGKKVSLLAADPPSFSAGCNGISWHFGGFAFISLDEIRQLVEAVAQASLGIAVDLAMQTLCPQCYAVMAKLRDMANMMRNAAADACKIAQNFGAMLKDSGIFPSTSRVSDCSKTTSAEGKTSSFLDSWAGTACRLLTDTEKVMDDVGNKTKDFLRFGTSSGKTPDREKLEMTGNVTYKALTALGFEDGPVKDVWLSLLGMTLIPLNPAEDCRTAFSNFYGSAKTAAADANLTATQKATLDDFLSSPSTTRVNSSSDATQPSPGDAKTTGSQPTAGGATKGPTFCNAPPLLSGMKQVGATLICGFNIDSEMQTFANNYFSGDLAALNETSLGAMCFSMKNQDLKDPMVYTCRKADSAECYEPKMTRLQTILPPGAKNGYTGLAWMVGDALYNGVQRIKNNDPAGLRPDTVSILNGSGWPLYRLLNMAAVYPGMARELLNAYTSAIATQYAMDTLDRITRIGAIPGIDLRSSAGLKPDTLSVIREQMMELTRDGNSAQTQVMARLAEKRQLVEVILQVNKTLQAEVIGQGLGGNTNLAVSIKRATAAQQKKN
ncbi:hypothetical protein WJ96_04080 [Burkholderia ubonensis]|uniref:Conjugal transfer protein TraH n=1 Tax=Burkholderia ubonensis TaxID=101571 RepID=A0AAW3MV87_9BURK|nr:conjugal transfer protein TraH [Burkholderia ubonensis]KVP65554.1 hypothetical protein WJ93_23825 [Burkholderia ubonensis]KVP96408.1 hypothetical protein WJ97_10990 [Burkholderia ubonensis]KVP97754.1 hypothetical protein WJ96_04080 [Burkholderia ubonensis]KVZ92451.1 hypothetical protein WL25_15735 [Burkholderia ubonensis]